MDEGSKAGRIVGATVSVDGETRETVSVDDTVDDSDRCANFAELQEVDRQNYVIGPEIARGGMGVILEARDRRTGRTLAIKEVRSRVMERSPAAVRAAVLRFRREAILTAQLQHPAIVPVYEIGRFGQTPFIAMKMVRGTPLDRLFAGSETAADRLALLPKVIDIAEAIAYAHSEGVVHRDLKPANVIAGDYGETVVIDWGLAKSSGDDDDEIGLAAAGLGDDVETVAGAVFGTPQYMAPEQAAGEVIGPRADVYALGAILYELLAGEAPYTSELDSRDERASAEEVVDLVARQAPRPIAELNPEAPADLVSIAEKAMARDREGRYASAAELAADLRAFELGQLVDVHDYSTFDLIRRWIGRHKAVVLTALVLLIAGAASTTWFVVQTHRQERRATRELGRAMRTMRDRGLDELTGGNLQRAAVALATAYQHLDDYPLRVAVAEVMATIDPFERELYRSPYRLGDIDVDRANRRVAIQVGDASRVIDLDGNTLFEVAGRSPQFTAGGDMLLTWDRGRVAVWSRDGARLRDIAVSNRQTWSALARLPRLVYVAAGELVVVSVSDGAELARMRIGSAAAMFGRIALSPDGRYVAMTSDQARLLEVATGEVRTLGPMSQLGSRVMDFSPDGSLLAISPRPGRIFLIDPASGDIKHRFSEHGRQIDALAFTGDSRHLVSIDADGGLCFRALDDREATCDLASRAALLYVHGDEVVSGHLNGTVRVWDVDGRVTARLAAHADGPTLAIPMGDGRVISGGDDGALRLWKPGSGRDALFAAGPGESVDVAGPLVFHHRGDRLTWFDPTRPDETTTIDVAAYHRPHVDAGGRVIAVAGAVYDRAGEPIAAVDSPELAGLAVHPRGDSLATCSDAGELSLIAVPGGQPRWTTDLSTYGGPGTFRKVSFSASGARLLVGVPGADLVLDAATGAILAALELEGRSTARVAIRGETRFVSAENNRLILWSAAGEIAAIELPGRVALARAPDGSHVVVGAATGIGAFAATDSGELTWLGRGQQTDFPIYALAVSPRGLIAASAADGRVYVYAADGQLLTTRHARSVNRLSFAGEDQLLIDGLRTARLWSLAPERRDPTAIRARVESLVNE